MPKDELETVHLSTVNLPKDANEIWEEYSRSKGTKAQLITQMLYFCKKNGFNADTSPLEWKEGQG